ncbi:BLUF domain-containing protein [Flavobacterium jejuense]|uniref:BLUF domain-containing protein n=1 Tax=Flavobacterium jejuense TaxID=1544455 RepID=A0ABX0IW15_9FLAO|nr:BLUF domain-containing protein [Flavobacterium jejuense]NHN26004.1 BLUF domain-containing protein [Flavobacterium jejuense]
MEIYQLTYKSKATSRIALDDLNVILERSNLNNSKSNITGCLVFYNDFFIQILEGSKEDVLQIYDKICADDRHHSIELLWQNTAEKRFFVDWNMGFYTPEQESEILFVNNYKLLSNFADKSMGSLMRFWISVEKILESKKLSF